MTGFAAAASPVTLSVNTGPIGGVLIGKTTVTTLDGIATFSGISANIPGTYTLTVTSNGFQSDCDRSVRSRTDSHYPDAIH